MPALPRAMVALYDPDLPPGPDLVRIVPPEQALISAFDRSFHFGDSLYEVTRSYDGILFSLDEHLARLRHSADLARFGELPEPKFLAAMVRDTCRAFFRAHGNRDVYARLTVSRGVGDVNIDRRTSGPPYAIVIVKELGPRPGGLSEDGMHWALVDRRRNLPTALDPAMKSGNYLNNVLALAEAQEAGADDALMLDYQGHVTEGTTSNFYAVVDGRVVTAPLEVGILRGITRDWLLQVCRAEGIPVEERRFGLDTLERASEMFLSSSTREVQAVTRLSGRLRSHGTLIADGRPGPVTRQVAAALRGWIDGWCARHEAESLFV